MKRINFQKDNPSEILKRNQKAIFNFFNLHNVWWFFKNPLHQNLISQEYNFNFPDGKILSLWLKTEQTRGPQFTKIYLNSAEAKAKVHFFVGISNEALNEISKVTKISKKNLKNYDLPFVSGLEFSLGERNKLIRAINRARPDNVWFAVGSPKQEILANQIFNQTNSKYFFTVGAAIDFLLGRKKEAPDFWSKIGLEWFYRLITDFKHTRKKAWRHFAALRYLRKVK